MNRYGQQAHDHYRQHRRTELIRITDPVRHFTTIGEQAQTAITDWWGHAVSSGWPAEPTTER